MKKILLIALALIFVSVAAVLVAAMPALATFYMADQKTIAWDPVENADGYIVYEKDAVTGAVTELGPVVGTSYTVTFTTEKQIYIGVKAIHNVTLADGTVAEQQSSDIAWSDMAQYCQGGATFGLYYLLPMTNVGGLRTN